MKRFLFLVLVPWILVACTATKKTASPDLSKVPDWVRKTPNDMAYYQGVGSAAKTAAMDYREKARQNALSDIAGNISVNISNTSVFSQFETDQKFSEYYRDNIKTTTKNYLEGYEMVDAYETKDRYWVYYRLSKAEYERIKNERISSALLKSEGEYRQMTEARAAGQTAEAIFSAIRAIEKVKDFLGEDLRSTIDGVNQSYPSRLLADLASILNGIRIEYSIGRVEVTRGQAPGTFTAIVVNEKNTQLQNISVISTFSYLPGTKSELVSDASGTIRISPGRFASNDKTATITSSVQFEKMVRETTGDPVVRKLLSNVKLPEFVLPVDVLPVVFTVEVRETTAGQPQYSEKLRTEISSLLNRDGFVVKQEPPANGFTIRVETNPGQTAERAGKFTAALSALYTVKDQAGNKLFDQNISDITGIGSTPQEAVADAFSALGGRIRISVVPAMYRQLHLQ